MGPTRWTALMTALVAVALPARSQDRRVAAPPDEARTLVSRLTELKNGDFDRPPVPEASRRIPIAPLHPSPELFLPLDPEMKPNPFRRLVELGPAALPVLLESLTDSRPTEFLIEHKGFMGGMEFGHVVPENPENGAECLVLKEAIERREKQLPGPPGKTFYQYRTKVGDLCFAAIGAITNRGYKVATHKPTQCLEVSSPVQDAKIAEEVRALWGTGDLDRKLFEWLRLDFESRDPWGAYQTGAAQRLLYYYPEEAVPIVAARLRALDVVSSDPGKRQKSNRLRAEDLVRIVSGFPYTGIRDELRSIAERTVDGRILEAALPGIDRKEDAFVLERIRALIALVPKTEEVQEQGFYLLKACQERLPEAVRDLFRDYLKDASLERINTACQAFIQSKNGRGDLALEILRPYLRDARPIASWTYTAVPDRESTRYPVRICDQAADGISRSNPADRELRFEFAGTPGDLDLQLERIRRRIERLKK